MIDPSGYARRSHCRRASTRPACCDEHTKALLRILIQELRVNSRAEIPPTYRIATPMGCATKSSVEPAGLEPATSTVQGSRSSN
jgi:hypothetical protein